MGFFAILLINARAASSGSIPAAVGYLLMVLTLTIACGFGALVIGGTLPSSLFSANDRRLGGPRATGILQRSHARMVGREIYADRHRDDDGGSKDDRCLRHIVHLGNLALVDSGVNRGLE